MVTVSSQQIKDHMGLVRHVVQRFLRRVPPNVDKDDLVAAGAAALFEMLRTGSDFCASYAFIRVRGAIVDELRRQDWISRRARDAGVQFTIASEEELENLEAPEVHANIDISCLLEGMPEREAYIVKRVLHGAKQKNIAVELGLSQARINQLHKRALKYMREKSQEAA